MDFTQRAVIIMNFTQNDKDTILECLKFFKTFRHHGIPSLKNYDQFNQLIDKIQCIEVTK